MGNRGILHDASGGSAQRAGAIRTGSVCRLAFKDRRRPVMAPGQYTELFFLDEATALAAGHRPCCACRREDFRVFQAAWRRAFNARSDPSAAAIDRALHAARIQPRTRRQVRFEASLDALPDGAFVLLPEDPSTPLLIFGDRLLPWRPSGYGRPRPRAGARRALVLTPRPTSAVLRAGYMPALHPSASRSCDCGDRRVASAASRSP